MQRASSELRGRFDRTVRVLCPLIAERLGLNGSQHLAERDLRRELVSCALGSQVTYGMATRAFANLESAGLLADRWWARPVAPNFEKLVQDVLAGRGRGLVFSGKYRFWRIRAHQLSLMRDQLAAKPAVCRVASVTCVKRLRRQIVAEISGIGPKQASMFLRNAGVTYELAVLDSHVIRFMETQRLLKAGKIYLGSIACYERVEDSVMAYARSLGYPVGYIDWAVWATMKAAQELRL